MSGLMKSFSFSYSQLYHEPCALNHHPAELFICDEGIFLGYQTIGPFTGLDSSSLVRAVDLCASTELI